MPTRNGCSATRVGNGSVSVLMIVPPLGFDWLDEIVLLFANYEYWAGRRAHNAFCSAADGEMFPACVAMRRHHNKIDIELFGCFDDFVRGDTAANTDCYFGNFPVVQRRSQCA